MGMEIISTMHIRAVLTEPDPNINLKTELRRLDLSTVFDGMHS